MGREETRINHVVLDCNYKYWCEVMVSNILRWGRIDVDIAMCIYLLMGMCVCKCISSFCPLRGTGNCITLVAMSTPSPQILLFKYHSPLGRNRTMWRNG